MDMPEFTTCEVIFAGTPGMTYTYKVTKEIADTLKPNDRVVVDGAGKLSVVWVTAVHDSPRIDPKAKFKLKWIIQRVELEKYEELMKRENSHSRD